MGLGSNEINQRGFRGDLFGKYGPTLSKDFRFGGCTQLGCNGALDLIRHILVSAEAHKRYSFLTEVPAVVLQLIT